MSEPCGYWENVQGSPSAYSWGSTEESTENEAGLRVSTHKEGFLMKE